MRLRNYGLCPSHYVSEPVLSWDSMLSMTKDEFEFVSDLEIHFFYEKDMRGGVSYNSKKYSKGNNPNILYTWNLTVYMIIPSLNFSNRRIQMDRP